MKNRTFICRALALVLVVVMLLPTLLTACSDDGKGTETGTSVADGTETGTSSDTDTDTNVTDGTETGTPSDTDTESTPGESGETQPPEGAVTYTILAKSQGGMLLSGVTVTLTDASGKTVSTGKTDENGNYTAVLMGAEYTVTLSDLKPGYTAASVKTTAAGGEVTVVADTAIITDQYPNQPASYAVGDVMYDFSFLKDGQEVKLSELLQSKKLVVLNFWATWCSPCKSEFPAIEEAYQAYGDQVEIVAFSISDSATKCEEFKTENGYSFTMTPNTGLYSLFAGFHGGASVPCTIFIDRYGVVAYGMVGGNPNAEAWKSEFAFYVSDDYTQNGSSGTDEPSDGTEQEKPNVQMPDSAEIEAAVNGEGFKATYTPSDSEYVWPWVLTEDKKAIRPANCGKHNTSAIINTELTFAEGQVFAFDYEYSIEYDTYGTQIYDMFAVYVDGHIMQTLVVPQDGWVTCYAYTPQTAGTHTISLAYTKDSSDGFSFMKPGQEYVHVKNLRMTTVADMTAAGGYMDVYRPAADGVAPENAATSYLNYATVVFNAEDGYYHVGKADGPLLLAKLCGSTQWSATSLEDLAYAGYLKIDGVDYASSIGDDLNRSYCWLEKYSKLGYSVVDEKLAGLLDLFASSVGDGKNHEWEWLEFCSYFDHYGVGSGITKVTDVRQGLDNASAFVAEVGKNHIDINNVFVPRGHYFKFVPDKTGVYTFYSLAEGATTSDSTGVIDTIAWLMEENGRELDLGDNEREGHFQIWHTLEAGKTYYLAVGFDPVDTLGSFDFTIEYVAEKLDVMTVCTGAWTTTIDASHIIIWRNYDFHAALGTDGYYHQVLGYEADGTPILDYSETGYVYVDMLGVSGAEGAGYIPWLGDWATLQKCIEQGYYTEDGKLHPGAFDFTTREDIPDELGQEMGNHQAEMEAYLAQAKAVDPDAFDYGYVKADEKLAHILTDLMMLYGMQDVDGQPVADEWLMFCCFARHV